MPFFAADAMWPKIALIAAGLFFGAILIYIILHPFIVKKVIAKSILIHPEDGVLTPIQKPSFNKIAIALDFSSNDSRILSYAIGQGNENTSFLLLHIVESAGARFLGPQTDDYETRNDMERMDKYVQQLKYLNYKVSGEIGFKNRVKEIVRIVKENDADMLVIGAHGHTGLKDFIYGETVNAVRHELKIPVLVVTL